MNQDIKISNNNNKFKFRVSGILIVDNKVLTVKINNNDFYCLPGGHVELMENTKDAIIREFKEETGLPLTDIRKDSLISLGTVQQNSGKVAIAFGLHYPNIDPNTCFSNVIEDGVTPEIDSYRWIPYDELENVTHKSHLIFYEQIKNMIGL